MNMLTGTLKFETLLQKITQPVYRPLTSKKAPTLTRTANDLRTVLLTKSLVQPG
jgi:hypothetical protein